MNTSLIKASLALSIASLLCACSVAKLEARLEANPQCKDVINPKTGALMPCPGSDAAFYKGVGLAPAKPSPAVISPSASVPAPVVTTATTQPSSDSPMQATTIPAKSAPLQADCKPQIHKKTGGMLPCPASD